MREIQVSKKIKKTKSSELNTKGKVWKLLKTRIEGYGFTYSFSDFLKTTLLFIAIMIIVGYFLRLTPLFIAIFILVVICMIPYMIISQFKYIYEQNRFNELTIYMEQMAYSFKKKPKILSCLKDTAEVTTAYKRMNRLINKAIQMIEYDYSDTIYTDALSTIQDCYECTRIVELHRFLCKIEEQGGEYTNSLDILIDDIAMWSQRTFVFQKERADIKHKIMLSLVLSMGICSTTLFMIPSNMDITSNTIYQTATTITLILFVGIYTLTQTKLNGSWLENDAIKNANQIQKDYCITHNSISNSDIKKARRKTIIISPLLIFGIFQSSLPIIAAAGILMFLFYQGPKNKLKYASRRTLREIEKELPGWCRDIAINLQTENVYRAIALTLNDCPIVLAEPIKQLLNDIDEMPGSVVPYNDFLDEFNIPEVNRLMKTLYSLSEYGAQDAETQINKIIVQNNALLEKSETIKNEDSIAGIKFVTLIPMLLGSCKMMIDLYLLCTSFMASTQIPM